MRTDVLLFCFFFLFCFSVHRPRFVPYCFRKRSLDSADNSLGEVLLLVCVPILCLYKLLPLQSIDLEVLSDREMVKNSAYSHFRRLDPALRVQLVVARLWFFFFFCIIPERHITRWCVSESRRCRGWKYVYKFCIEL